MSRPIGYKHTEISKKKMKENHKGFSGHKHSEESKRKTSMKLKLLDVKPMLGKKHSSEVKLLMSKNRSGINNANWKGGITATSRGIRRSPEYYQWRKEVLKKDNNICQKCNNKKSLHAHHIKPILNYPEKIFQVENGITLCRKCHREEHNESNKN